jgi:hypothetical protein
VRLGRCGSAGWPTGTASGGRKPGCIDLYGDRVAGGLRPVAVLPCRRAGPTASSAGPRDRVGGYSARDRDDHEDRTYRSIDLRCAGRVRARGVRAVRGRVPAVPRAGRAAVRPCPLDGSWTAGGASRPFAPIRSTGQSTSWWRTPKPAATPDGWPATRTAAGRRIRGRCPVTPRYGCRLPSSSTTLSRSRFGGWSTPGSRSCWSGRRGLGRRTTRAPTPRSAPTVAAPVSSCTRWLVS